MKPVYSVDLLSRLTYMRARYLVETRAILTADEYMAEVFALELPGSIDG